jgi:hypothetical protein
MMEVDQQTTVGSFYDRRNEGAIRQLVRTRPRIVDSDAEQRSAAGTAALVGGTSLRRPAPDRMLAACSRATLADGSSRRAVATPPERLPVLYNPKISGTVKIV